MAKLGPSIWRIEVYDIRDKVPFSGYITDISNFYTSDLKIKRQRNYPDEVTFTLDLNQLQIRSEQLGLADPHDLLEPYMHKVKIFRDNKYICQAIVIKTSVNLTNNPTNTIDVSCVDILGIFEKRIIHQDYGNGSWAGFAKRAIMDAQHEPNRIYNYAFEGDAITIDNKWFRGWKYRVGNTTRNLFPDWMPNTKYEMYNKCNCKGKFWEAKEHAFYSGEEFSESNWTLLGILNDETGEVAPVYGVWRESDDEPGPTGTMLGGWGGTSSCHMTAQTYQVNNGSDVSGISMAGSEISTSLVAPYPQQSAGSTHHLHSKIEIYPILSTTIKLFVEGHGGANKTYTANITKSTTGSWQTIEYDWTNVGFDIYRFGIQIVSGEALVDSPAVYQDFCEGDEWDLGVRVGEFPSAAEQTDAGWLQNRHTPTYEWKDAKSTILDLSNMDSDNFWYDIDENYKFNVYVNKGSKTVDLELSYPRNITTMTIDTNASNIVNYIKGDGSAEVTQDPLVSGIENSNAAPFTWIGYNQTAMNKYWALASAESYDSERDIVSLKNDIEAAINTYSDIQDVPVIKISNNSVSPEDIGLGDIVSVEALDIPYVKRVNGLYKITAYDINIDTNGNESITLTLLKPSQTQINALSFPQLIKNLQKRLGH